MAEPDGNCLHEESTVEELKDEPTCAQKHTHRLGHKTDRTKTRTRTRSENMTGEEGRWWFVPAGVNVRLETCTVLQIHT